ncbi:MAG: response regulator [Rhodocyclaceae bacterium]|nr:response regulator [Rhodocyclaceae bacterium]
MEAGYTVFVVDDDETMRLLLESVLGDQYAFEAFDSAESCLKNLGRRLPSLFLLDVNLPGINGHELCRRIKDIPDAKDIPVIFISSHDDLDTMLAGYDSGGDDYVVKPFDVTILNRKIENLRRIERAKGALLEVAKSSDELATLVLANLDEYVGLIKFLRQLNDCEHPRSLLNLLFELLRGYKLQSAIQLRMPGVELTVSEEGENRPFEVAVINHVRNMDRILQFKTRAAYNFEHITILINNMPLHDQEFCGRIRDHLAIAAECANARLQSQITKAENAQSKATARGLLDELQRAVSDFDSNYRLARDQGSAATQDLLDDLAKAFASLGLSEDQEAHIEGIVREKTRQLTEIYDFSNQTETALNEIAGRIADIMNPLSTVPGDLSLNLDFDDSEPPPPAIQLF